MWGCNNTGSGPAAPFATAKPGLLLTGSVSRNAAAVSKTATAPLETLKMQLVQVGASPALWPSQPASAADLWEWEVQKGCGGEH